MSVPITRLLLLVLGGYGLIILGDLLITRAIKRCVIEGIILGVVIIILRETTGFPTPKQSFGDQQLLLAIGIMLICTILGMASRYIFYYQKFKWGSFLRPLVISPLILFPLIGTAGSQPTFEPIQLISFGLLSFQNGFFWKEVFERIRKEMKEHDDEAQATP